MTVDRLFVMHVIIAVEEQWFAPGNAESPIKVERRHHIDAILFAATDEDEAYRMAIDWLPGFSDSHHDGVGDLTRMFAVGLHELDEVSLRVADLSAAVREMYGVDVGKYDPSMVDITGLPQVRSKDELQVFRAGGPG